MSDDSERSALPWAIAALVLVVGGAKIDAARPIVARALALALPVLPVAIGVKRFEGGDPRLERAAGLIGWLTIAAGEICVAGGFFHLELLDSLGRPARVALYLSGVLALAINTIEARTAGKSRFAGYIGIAAAFSLYLSTHAAADIFANVFGAIMIAIVLGGGAGLLLGELLGRAFKKA